MGKAGMQPKSGVEESLFRFVSQKLASHWRRMGSAAIFSICVLAVAGVAGCNSKPTMVIATGSSLEGAVVRVACPNQLVEDMVKNFGQRWASEEHTRLVTVRYDPSAGPEKSSADLWIISPAAMPFWAAADQLHLVPDTYKVSSGDYRWDDLLPLYRAKLLLWDGKAYALPILGEATLCFYREDLWQDPQHQEAFRKKFGYDLAPPTTWEQVAQIAEYFHNQKRPGIDHACASLPPLPESDLDLDREFYFVTSSFDRLAVREDEGKPLADVEMFSFHYDLATGAARIDKPSFVHSLQLLQKLQAYRLPGTAKEPAASFQKGEAVLCLADPSWIRRFQENRSLRGKFGICLVPGAGHVFGYHTGAERPVAGSNQVPYLGSGGWLGVVPRSNAQPTPAFALAAFLGSPKTSRDVVIEPAWGGGVFRSDHLRLGWQSFDLDSKKTERLTEVVRETVVHAQVKDPVIGLRIPDERSHREALDEEVRAALVKGKDAAGALRAALERWQKLDASKDVGVRLVDYRLSLGLSRVD